MSSPVSETLYEWMRERRIIALVAEEMRVPHSTLANELRSGNHQAKLGADELVPLFQAIRKVGNGKELKGIVQRFTHELQGEEQIEAEATEDQFLPQFMNVVRYIGLLSEAASRLEDTQAEQELVKIKTMIRTEIVPAIFKMEDIVGSRLSAIRAKAHSEKPASVSPSPILQPVHKGA